MTDHTQEIIQRLHTILQNSLVGLPTDKKSDCLVAMQFPGLPVDPAGYEEDGLSDSLRNILDTGVHIQTAYQPTGSSLFGLFGQILGNTELPAGRELSSKERQRLKVAETYLSKNNTVYQKYYDKYLTIQEALLCAKSRKEYNAAQMQMKRLEQEWTAHGRQKYEEYSKIIRELHTSSPASYFAAVKENYELFPDARLDLSTAGWYLKEDGLSWTSMELTADVSKSSASSQTTSTNEKLEEFYKSPGIWSTIAGWFGAKKGDTVTKEIREVLQKANEAFSSSNMRMTWEMIAVSVQRPWLDLNVLAVKDAKMAGVAPGAYSTGALSADNKGTFPGYITAFIVAKDIEMTMTLSSDLAESLKKNRDTITCGPVANGGGNSINIVERSDNKDKNTSDVTISTGPGKQIIGYIIQPFPCFPSA